MFITVETPEGGEATINTAFITHVTQLESFYAEGGSCVHFTTDRVLQLKLSVTELTAMLKASEPAAQVTTSDNFLLQS